MMLSAGVHTGTRNSDDSMKEYIWRRRSDGVHILNIGKTWEKLMLAARVIVANHQSQIDSWPFRLLTPIAVVVRETYRGTSSLLPVAKLTAADAAADGGALRVGEAVRS